MSGDLPPPIGGAGSRMPAASRYESQKCANASVQSRPGGGAACWWKDPWRYCPCWPSCLRCWIFRSRSLRQEHRAVRGVPGRALCGYQPNRGRDGPGRFHQIGGARLHPGVSRLPQPGSRRQEPPLGYLLRSAGTNSGRRRGQYIGGNIVVVSASGLSWAWMVPLLRSAAPLQFSVSSADIMEATPVAGAPAR